MAAASYVYNISKRDLMNGSLDLDTSDIRVTLCMTNSTAKSAANLDADTNTAITTIDEFDGANYTATGKQLTITVGAPDDTNNRGEAVVSTGSTTWTAKTAGTRKIMGALVYRWSTNFDSSIPVGFVSFTNSFAANGGDIKITWSSEGIFQVS